MSLSKKIAKAKGIKALLGNQSVSNYVKQVKKGQQRERRDKIAHAIAQVQHKTPGSTTQGIDE